MGDVGAAKFPEGGFWPRVRKASRESPEALPCTVVREAEQSRGRSSGRRSRQAADNVTGDTGEQAGTETGSHCGAVRAVRACGRW